MSRSAKALASISLLILLSASIQFILILQGLEGWTSRAPQWDPSVHALDSIHFARALRHFSLPEFLVQLHNSAMWPPVIPLLQAPFHLIFGESIFTARNWTAWTVVPAVILTFLVGFRSHRRFGLLVGSVAAAMLLISPVFQEHALQEMLEVPGIALCMLTLACYLHYLNNGDPRAWRSTCLAGIVLFFAKFNYAVLIMLPIVVCEFCLRSEFREMVLGGLRRFIKDVRWRSGFTAFVLVYSLFLVYAQKVGIRFSILGQTVVIEKAFGNPLYILLAILLIRNWIKNRELLKGYAREIWEAPEPLRSLLRFDILPALVWLSYPVFFMHFFLYMFNEKTRQSSFWSMETLTFYPGAIVNSYAPSPWLGWASLIAFFAMLLAYRRLPVISRFLTTLALFNITLTIMHPNYQVRYLMTSIPLLYLVLALALAHALEALLPKSNKLRDGIVLALGPILALSFVLGFKPQRDHLQGAFLHTSQSEAMRSVFAAICRDVKDTETNTVVGFSNYVSPSAIALSCYEIYPDIRRAQLPTALGRLGFPNEKDGTKIVAANKVDRFFVVDYSRLGFSPGRLQESFLLDALKAALPSSSYTSEILLDQGDGGVKLTVYRRRVAKPESH